MNTEINEDGSTTITIHAKDIGLGIELIDNKFYLTKHGEILYTKKELESEQSPSAPKVEVSAESLVKEVRILFQQKYPFSHPNSVFYKETVINLMANFATLKTDSLIAQSTKDAKEIVELREEVDRLKESLLKIVHGSIHDAYTTAKEALKVKP